MPAVKLLEVRGTQQTHLLTFDVEHWYEGFRYRGLDGWQAHPPRDDKIVERLLDKLGETGQRSTMFFTGRYAEEFPQVLRRAAQEGHEIASHSYSHTVLSRMKNIEEFRADLLRSVTILEDASGCKIKGYRAPKWSISEQNRQEVLSVLVEAGFEYDSSVFPRIFGGSSAVFPHLVELGNGARIWEVPATTYPIFGLRVPVAGGLYFRLLPLWVTRRALSLCHRAGQPSMIYLHPYDLDANCPRLLGGNALFQWLRYYGINTAFDRLDVMLRHYKFSTMLDWVRENETVPVCSTSSPAQSAGA
jgi:polysaccharide deacetylase family protein (PEP-CTERM system associated)